jgi:hypothetical protein
MSVSIKQDPIGPRDPRIIDIGPSPFMWRAFPRTTQFFSTWPGEGHEDHSNGLHIVSLTQLPRLAALLRSAEFDLVVVHASQLAPWAPESISRTLFRRSTLDGHFPLFRRFGQQMIRCKVAAPIAVLDLDDPPVIARSDLFALDRARFYFKRELPPDYWRLFSGTLHARLPTPRFRSIAGHQARLAKIRPISLGLSAEIFEWSKRHELPKVEKTVDVFFSGRIMNSSMVRQRGIEELLALQADGYVIDVCEQRLPIEEYLARCAAAWIVWAPEGFGWQSFRQYEAAFCGAVPLCNRPTIELHQPLVHAIHALYYEPEPGALRDVLGAALADRDRLRTIAEAGRRHVLSHHTPVAIARYVAERTLDGGQQVPSRGPAQSSES